MGTVASATDVRAARGRGHRRDRIDVGVRPAAGPPRGAGVDDRRSGRSSDGRAGDRAIDDRHALWWSVRAGVVARYRAGRARQSVSGEGVDSGSRSYGDAREEWPGTPDGLVYRLDAVQDLFSRAQRGEQVDLLDALLDCVDWAEMFGSADAGFLRRKQSDELKRYYRARFQDIEPFYLAEQLSTELMTALMVSGEMAFS